MTKLKEPAPLQCTHQPVTSRQCIGSRYQTFKNTFLEASLTYNKLHIQVYSLMSFDTSPSLHTISCALCNASLVPPCLHIFKQSPRCFLSLSISFHFLEFHVHESPSADSCYLNFCVVLEDALEPEGKTMGKQTLLHAKTSETASQTQNGLLGK